MLGAGKLRERVTIQRPTSQASPEWGRSDGWEDVATTWASVEPVAAAERFSQKGVESLTTHVVRVRYRTDLTEACRLVWRGNVLDIIGVVDVGAGQVELEIAAVEHGKA